MVKKTIKKAPAKRKSVKAKAKPEVVVETPELEPDIPVTADETFDPTPVTDEEALATLEADEAAEEEDKEEEPKPEKEPKPVKEKEAKAGEWWYNSIGEDLMKRGHGQRNLVLKAGREAGLEPSEAIARFAAFNGNFRERILSLFDEE
jgi:hypothetical protein